MIHELIPGIANVNLVQSLTDSNFLSHSSFGVARNSILITDSVQKAVNYLERHPFPVAVALQFLDFLDSAIVRSLCQCEVLIVPLQSCNNGLLMTTCCVLEFLLHGVALD